MKSAGHPTHIHKLTVIRTQSVSGADKAERLHCCCFGARVAEEKRRKMVEKKNTTRWLPSSLLSSLWAEWIPNCSSLRGAHTPPSLVSSVRKPEARLREGVEGGMEAGG